MRRSLIVLIFALLAVQVSAQEESAEANLQTQKALELLQSSQAQPEAERLRTLVEIVAILESIATEYPDSLPGQRIRDNQPLGPLDITALRAELAAAGIAVPPAEPEVPPTWHAAALAAPADMVVTGHGALIQPGPQTHAGIDVALPCGTEVVAPFGGTVALVVPPVAAADGAEPSAAPADQAPDAADTPSPDASADAGAVLLAHAQGDETASLTLYSGLAEVAVAAGSQVARGQVLGTLGRAHESQDCALHFEARKPGFGGDLHHPLWDGLTGMGDWRADPLFGQAWFDPIAWLFSVDPALAGDAAPPIASAGSIDARPLMLPILPQDGVEFTLPQGAAPLVANARLTVRPEGLEVAIGRVRGNGEIFAATASPAAGQTDYRLVLTIEARSADAAAMTYEQVVSPSMTAFVKILDDTLFLIPPDVIAGAQLMRVELVAPSGETVGVGGDLMVAPSQSDVLTLIQERETVRGLSVALWNCIDTIHREAIGHTILVLPPTDSRSTVIAARPTDLWAQTTRPQRIETLTLLSQECLNAADGAMRRLPPGGVAFVVTDRPAQ